MAVLLQDQGKLGEAEPLMREVLEVRRATLGPKHPSTLTSISTLALLLEVQGKLSEAHALYRETVEGMHFSLGPQHPDTISDVASLARLTGMLQRKGGKGARGGAAGGRR